MLKVWANRRVQRRQRAAEGQGARSPLREFEGRALNCANGATPSQGKKISARKRHPAALKIGVPSSHQRKSTKEQLITIKGKQHQNADFYCAKERTRFSHKEGRTTQKSRHERAVRKKFKQAIFRTTKQAQHFSAKKEICGRGNAYLFSFVLNQCL